jgi:hypothetical protein
VRSVDGLELDVQLDAAGSKALDKLADAQLGKQIAFLSRGRLISAPTMDASGFKGRFQLGGLKADEATALARDLGGDPTVPPPDPNQQKTTRAIALCNKVASSLGIDVQAMGSQALTAGEITKILTAIDKPIEPWRSLPADHFVAACSFPPEQNDATPTTVCPNGDIVDVAEPRQVYVDEDGRSTPIPTPDLPQFDKPCAP